MTFVKHKVEKKKFKKLRVDDEYEVESMIRKIGEKSILISGKAGSGKSFLIKQIIKKLIKNNKKFRFLAPTHKIARKHNGSTLHEFFYVNPFEKDKKNNCIKSILKMNLDTIIVDEASMISKIFYEFLLTLKKNDIRIILCGDYQNQLLAVGEEKENMF